MMLVKLSQAYRCFCVSMCLYVCSCCLLTKYVVHLACTTSHTEKFIVHIIHTTCTIYVLAQKAHTTVLDLWPKKTQRQKTQCIMSMASLHWLAFYQFTHSFHHFHSCKPLKMGKGMQCSCRNFPKKTFFKLDNYFVIN